MNAFKINDVTFGYSKTTVLDKISVDIKKSQFTSICGKNGSGKSTLIKLLAGILKPSTGTIKLYDNEIHNFHTRELYKIISYVPQAHMIEIPLTVNDIILTSRHPFRNLIEQNKKDDLEMLEKTLHETNLMTYRDTIFNNLSGGEKQKVMIARALCQTRDVILLDEPTSSLDIGNKIEIMEILKKLTKAGTTVVTVSHDINELNKYSDNVIFISENKALTDDKEKLLSDETLKKIYGADIKHVTTENEKIFYF